MAGAAHARRMSEAETDSDPADAVTDAGDHGPDPTRDDPPDTVRVEANGLTFACRYRGDGDRLALCLHGFPDDPATFDPLLERLAAAGFTAVAPYVRGYGPTDAAPDWDYSPGALARDAVALADALAAEFGRLGEDSRDGDGNDDGGDGNGDDTGSRTADPILVGHDWGAVAGYAVGRVAPDRYSHVVAMAVPPAFAGRMLRSPRQWLRSWYVGFFQLPWLPERALRAREFTLVERLWRRWSPGWDYPDERIASVRATFRSPGTVPAALAYYRQFGRGLVGSLVGGSGGGDESDGDGPPPIGTPTLVLAGADDGCIGAGLFDGADEAIAAPSRTRVLDDAGHFLHRERPDAVAEELLAFVEA